MRTILSIIALSILTFSCEKDSKETDNASIEGVYTGTFVRTGMDTASVQIEFTTNKYSGSSNIEKYPAICNGTYTLAGNTIEFKDACEWAADFDWTLALNGNFSYQNMGGEIIISRSNGSVKDEYRLRRITR